jgi:DNA-binding MarR family transcriptional regulator
MSVGDRIGQPRFRSASSRAFVSLIVAAEHLSQDMGDLCARHEITGDQYNVLRILRGAHPRGHPRGEIRKRLMRRAPDVTRLLDRLEAQGLVARAQGDEDRRASVARITPKGLALLERLDPEAETLMRRLTAPLSPDELRELARLCDALVP